MPTNIEVYPGGGFTLHGIDRNKVLFNAAYWDKVVIPSDFMFKSSFDGEDELLSEGVLETPKLDLPDGVYFDNHTVHATVRAQIAELDRRNSEMPGQWAMMDTPLAKLVEIDEFSKDRGLLVELYGALPAPSDDTPIDKVLEFKRKRSGELHRLRTALEKIYLTIASSPDEEMALRHAVDEIDKSCADLMKSSKEDWKAAKPADMKSIAQYAATVAMPFAAPYLTQLGYTLSLPHVTAAAAGVAAFKVLVDVGKKRKADRANPYWFAVDLKKSGLGQ